MKWVHHLFSAVQFFQVLLLILGGLFCLALPFAPSLRVAIANLFLFKEAALACVGGALLVVGLILGIGFYFLQKHWTLHVSMNPPTSVESEVVADLVKAYLKKRFPDQTFKTEVLIASDGSLSLMADMPAFSSPDLEKNLQKIEAEVGQLLKRSFNYQKKFNFTFVA